MPTTARPTHWLYKQVSSGHREAAQTLRGAQMSTNQGAAFTKVW